MIDIIIIPTYNEKENIGNLLRTIFAILPSVNVLVVDDNSPDGTAKIVEETKKDFPNLQLLLRSKKQGLGRAYVTAFKKVLAHSEIRSICTMDADFSHSIQYLSEMLKEIEKFDMVIGSRYTPGGKADGWPFLRRVLSRLANFYCQTILRLPIKDYTSGFICIKPSLLRKIELEEISAQGFAFLIKLKYHLLEKGGAFKEIPINLENRREGKSKITKGIILEGLLIPWKLIFRSFLKKIEKFFLVSREALKKRGIFYLVRYGPKVIYKTYFNKRRKFFTFQNRQYEYFYHLYNCTYLNERAVEIPIIWEIVKKHRGKRILEVGNVLSHYFNCQHDIIDKYEKFNGVINQDIVDFRPKEKYDLIVSISTLEHVGFDEEIKDPGKISVAIENLKKCLVPGGKIVATMCLGYNPEMDKLLSQGKIKFTKQYFLKRISNDNDWKEVSKEDVLGIGYNFSCFRALGLFIGIIEK